MALVTAAGRHMHRTYTGHDDACGCQTAIKIGAIEREMKALLAERILARMHKEATESGRFNITKSARILTEEGDSAD